MCEGRDHSSGWSKRPWLQRGISLKTCWIYHCPSQLWQTHIQTQIQTHMNTHVFSFMGCELRSPHHILSYSSQKSNPIFPHRLFYTVSFLALSLSCIIFSRSHSPSISLSHSPRLSLGRPPFRQRGVCQVPNP